MLLPNQLEVGVKTFIPGHLVGQGTPGQQNHMPQTEEETSSGCWLQTLKPWTSGRPLNLVLSYLSPHHPPGPRPVTPQPCHVPCSTPRRRAGLAGWCLGSCVEGGVMPAVCFCGGRLDPARSQVYPHAVGEAAQGRRAGQH